MVFFATYSESFRGFMFQEPVMNALPWITIMLNGSLELLESSIPWIAYVILGCSVLLYGPLTAGYFYYLRNSAREEHVWFSDIYTKGRKNWKQGLFFGLLDLLILYSIMNYAISYSVGDGAAVSIYNFTKYLAFFLGILYYLMRFYIYTMLVTFDLKVIQLIKNGMIFLIVNLKWNFWTLVLTVFATGLTFFIPFFIGGSSILVYLYPIAFILYPIFFLTFIHFAGVYNGYNVIDKYMVQPALADARKANPPEKEESVFHDE
jgi:uncharacterized membrane protein YesL